MLSIKNLTKTYKGGKTAVSDLSLTVEAGTFTDSSVITVPERPVPSNAWWEFMDLTRARLPLTVFP